MAYPPRVGDFRIGKTLGEGSFGKVKLGVDSRGRKVRHRTGAGAGGRGGSGAACVCEC